MSRNIVFAPGEFYHIYNRGTDKRDIFLNRYDYHRFQCLLYVSNGSSPVDLKLQGRTLYEVDIDRGELLVDVCGYVLMPNHFHLLVKARSDHSISNFMRKLSTAYTMYFNAKEERTGALFQGKFKAKHVNDDVYLQYLLSYIHLNPVKLVDSQWKETGIVNRPEAELFLDKYEYSSFLDYTGNTRVESVILNKEAFPGHFAEGYEFKEAVNFWLQGPTLEG